MRTISIEVPVELPADQVFTQLADAGGLGRFVAEPLRHEVDRGEPKIEAAEQRLSWQDGELGGEVSVVDRQPGTCAVQVELRTERTDEELIRTELQRAVASLSQRALVEDGSDETGRAWH